MIKFFRHIRKSLLMENKTGKYFKYAIGEIVLVVIGILIALQINNWNERRKDRIEEHNILNRLINDFEKDITQLDFIISSTQKRMSNIDSISKILQAPTEQDIMKFARLQTDLVMDNYFTVNSGTFDEGLSSGKLKVIQNDTLREQIFNYYRIISNSKGNDNFQHTITNEYLVPLMADEVFTTRNMFKMMTNNDSQLPELNLNELATSKAYHKALIFSSARSFQIRDWTNYKKLAIHLKKSVETELNNHN